MNMSKTIKEQVYSAIFEAIIKGEFVSGDILREKELIDGSKGMGKGKMSEDVQNTQTSSHTINKSSICNVMITINTVLCI